jgi:hypothetical protein
MTNEYGWIKALKVGDQVAIDIGRYGQTRHVIVNVEGITPAGNIKAYGCVFNSDNGWQRGGDKWHPYYLKEASAELRAKIAEKAERSELIDKIESVKFAALSTAKLRAILAVLESEQAE